VLYTFKRLARFLTQKGYADANQRGVQIIRRDLTLEEQAGNIEFKDDGIYLTINGQEYKGYMYIKNPFIVNYGNKFPKFHITNCEVIQEQKAKGKFAQKYYWHNSNLVDLTDTQTGEQFNQVSLELCSKCKAQSDIREYSNTQGFFSLLDQQEIEETTREIQLDMRGRPLDWDSISKEYRQEQNYTCENCGFGGEMLESRKDREFIHTDHIVAWELENMRRKNLECLCILCHSQKDEVHKKNFSKPGMQKRLKRFIDKYGKKLKEIGNPYIDNI
jgi:5-methylcytosine-specific restriction endonuclease McrA